MLVLLVIKTFTNECSVSGPQTSKLRPRKVPVLAQGHEVMSGVASLPIRYHDSARPDPGRGSGPAQRQSCSLIRVLMGEGNQASIRQVT